MSDEQPPRTTAPMQNLRFVVASDPTQFRDRSTMRGNRSHVMHNHLSERRQSEASRGSSVEGSRVLKRTRSTTPSRVASRTGSPLQSQDPPEPPASTEQTISSLEALAIYRRTQDPKPRRRTTASSSTEIRRSNTGDSSRSGSAPLRDPVWYGRPGSVPLVSTPPPLLPQAFSLLQCENDMLAPILSQTLVKWQNQPGSGWGSTMMPLQMNNRPTITIDLLRCCCLDRMHEHGTVFYETIPMDPRNYVAFMGTMVLALPEMSVPGSALSYAAGAANSEALEILNRGFQTDANVTQVTSMAVLFLVVSAVLDLDDNRARIHEEGLLRIVEIQGGLAEMSPLLSNVILSIVSLAAFTRRGRLHHRWAGARDILDRPSARPGPYGPHSPLLYPQTGFGMCFDPAYCLERTQIVLRAACGLTSAATELVDLQNTSLTYSNVPGAGALDDSRLSAVTHSIEEIASTITVMNQSPADDDHVFDACRIAAALYLSSIQHRVPYQQSADIVSDQGIRALPVQSLVIALQHTDLSSCWDNMCGVLLWVTLVGSAAAADNQEKSWLLGIAMKCCIVLLVERGDAVVESMRTLLEVSSLWADGGAASAFV